MLVNCSCCGTLLELSPGPRYFRCPVCYAICNRPSSAPQHPLSGGFVSVHGRKKAVICGIAYRNTRYELKGCINDARCMKYLLVHRFKFPESSVLMLTDEEFDPFKRPNKNNIRLALRWLVQGCQPGDSLVFHFAGHGSQTVDPTGEEVDGHDENLWPLDHKTQGVILDDEINATIVRPLPQGVKLHAIVDACHSGTVLDLPFLCRMNRWGQYVWEDHRPRSGAWCGTSGGLAISFSGCDDNQKAADTKVRRRSSNLELDGTKIYFNFGDNLKFNMTDNVLSKVTTTGAMTFSFIHAIESGNGATYGSILNSMRATIRSSNSSDGKDEVVTSLFTMLQSGVKIGDRLTQEPQLTASEGFDVYTKPFSLEPQ